MYKTKNVDNCEVCGIDISKMRNNKYCSIGCRQIAYHRNHGVQVWVKPCGCGCGGIIVSKNIVFKRDTIIGHPKSGKILSKQCSLCRDDVELLYDYQLPTFKLKLCLECYEKVFDLAMET